MPTHHELSVSDQEQASFWIVKNYNQQIYQELPTFLSFHLKISRCSVGPNEMSWVCGCLGSFIHGNLGSHPLCAPSQGPNPHVPRGQNLVEKSWIERLTDWRFWRRWLEEELR